MTNRVMYGTLRNLEMQKKESEKTSISFSEYCRRKLKENCKLEVIERLLREALEKNGKK